jgi:hypothetical protein
LKNDLRNYWPDDSGSVSTGKQTYTSDPADLVFVDSALNSRNQDYGTADLSEPDAQTRVLLVVGTEPQS